MNCLLQQQLSNFNSATQNGEVVLLGRRDRKTHKELKLNSSWGNGVVTNIKEIWGEDEVGGCSLLQIFSVMNGKPEPRPKQ